MSYLKRQIAALVEWIYMRIPCEWHAPTSGYRHAEKWLGNSSYVGGEESAPIGPPRR